MSEELTLTLIRGVPGTGKTTLAKRMAAERGWVHAEADQSSSATANTSLTIPTGKHRLLPPQGPKHWGKARASWFATRFLASGNTPSTFVIARTFGAEVEVITLTQEYGSSTMYHRNP